MFQTQFKTDIGTLTAVAATLFKPGSHKCFIPKYHKDAANK
jgi:hypothetical protein